MYAIIKIPKNALLFNTDNIVYLNKDLNFNHSNNVWECSTRIEAEHMLMTVNNSNCVITIGAN